MRAFIHKLVREKLNEVEFNKHFYERSEDRVWGNKPEGPASINIDAWNGNSVDTVDLTALDNEMNRLYIQKNVPITQAVKKILSKIKFLENINFNTDKNLGIIFWKSMTPQTGKDQNPKGGTLLTIVRNNTAMNIQWQPNKDVNITGGKVTGVDVLLYFEDLMDYVERTGVTTITTKDIQNILKHKSGITNEPTKPAEKIINVNGVKYVIINNDGDIRQKNGDKVINFEKLSDEIQTQVLSNLD